MANEALRIRLATHIVIIEGSEWEGETWCHVIPMPKNVDELAAVDLLPDISSDFAVRETNYPPAVCDSGEGYMAECVYLPSTVASELLALVTTSSLDGMEDVLYKGGIRRLVKDVN